MLTAFRFIDEFGGIPDETCAPYEARRRNISTTNGIVAQTAP